MATAQDVLNTVHEDEIRWIDLQFTDIEGSLHHVSVHSRYLNAGTFSRGVPKLDSSSIRGFHGAPEEMVLLPDPDTYAKLPWDQTTARLFCNLQEPKGGSRSDFDSRYVAKKAESALMGFGYTSKIGLQLEFYIFDNVTVDAIAPHKSQGYSVDSREAAWNYYGQNYPIANNSGYMAVPPKDALSVFRSNISDMLEGVFGIEISSHKHGQATCGHSALELKYSSLLGSADNVMTSKYVVKNAGTASNLMATFMPKPIYTQRGSALRVHQSLWVGEKNAFYDPSNIESELSQAARYYVGGILGHAPALCAITNPTTNSYKRLLTEGFTRATWGVGSRTSSVRVPIYEKGNEDSKRIDYRVPDPACNPYLALSAIVMAGLDGIKNKVEPGDPVKGTPLDSDLDKRMSPKLPRSLRDALESLKSDNAFLKAAFPSAILDRYLELKGEDVLQDETMPTPLEFRRYLDV
ncbi:MAG: glutamine synthetase beta-grasp domain-containing protein [Candidatus Micrarchaeota archaeon]